MELLPHSILLAILIVLSGLFSASETAIFSLTRFDVKKLQKQKPRIGDTIAYLRDTPRRTLTTILIGNILVNVTATAMFSFLAMRLFGDAGIGMTIGIMTFLLLLFGEITPKTFAIRNAEFFSSTIAFGLHLFSKLIFPIRWLLAKLADFFIYLLLGKKVEREPFITQRELRTLISIGEKEGIIDSGEKQMIQTVFEFSERFINEIMTPRVDIVACEKGNPPEKLKNIMLDSHYTKIPVYEGGIDNISGVVFAKEFLLSQDAEWQKLIRPVLFVPETKRIDDLLTEFQNRKETVAIVVDEYGGTAGLVTLEDILEELVGDIQDEYDFEEIDFQKISADTSKVNGDVSIRDINEKFGINIKTEKAETIGGFLLLLLGRIPKVGENFTYKSLSITIDEVKGKRIKQLTIKNLKAK